MFTIKRLNPLMDNQGIKPVFALGGFFSIDPDAHQHP